MRSFVRSLFFVTLLCVHGFSFLLTITWRRDCSLMEWYLFSMCIFATRSSQRGFSVLWFGIFKQQECRERDAMCLGMHMGQVNWVHTIKLLIAVEYQLESVEGKGWVVGSFGWRFVLHGKVYQVRKWESSYIRQSKEERVQIKFCTTNKTHVLILLALYPLNVSVQEGR